MKKILCLFFVLVLAGCGAKSGVMKCSRTTNQSNLKMDLTYEVSYTGKYVTRIQSIEKVTTDDEFVFEAYKKQIENILSPYKDVKYYKSDVKVDGNTIISKTDINYSKIDTKKLIEIDSANGSLIRDGKISLEDLEKTYNTIGINCKK